MLRIRSPVTACLGYFNESSADCEGRMPGIVCNYQHLIAERRNQEKIDFREYPRHLKRNLATHAISLHKIDRRKKPGLAKAIWPCIRYLGLQLIDFMTQREFFKSGCSFCEED